MNSPVAGMVQLVGMALYFRRVTHVFVLSNQTCNFLKSLIKHTAIRAVCACVLECALVIDTIASHDTFQCGFFSPPFSFNFTKSTLLLEAELMQSYGSRRQCLCALTLKIKLQAFLSIRCSSNGLLVI